MKKKNLPKCFWITNTGICTRHLDEGKKCKGICEWYIKKNFKVTDDRGFSGMKKEDYE